MSEIPSQATPRARFRSLVDVLRTAAQAPAEQPAYTFLTDGEAAAERLSFAELDLRARRIAVRVRAAAAPGERALLLFPPGLDFISAFFGCLYAGVVAVPAYPPRLHRAEPRLRSLVTDCRPQVILTTAVLLGRAAKVRAANPELALPAWLAVDGLSDGEDDWRPPALAPGHLAFLQYTSGSTAEPKGVMVTHGNLLHNEEMIRRAFDQRPDSVIVGWLPLYHDMGLIGNVLQPLCLGARCVLMSPLAFLQKPLRWLQAISRYRGTTSGGPNFAYDLCVQKVRDEEKAGLDLSSWRVAFNGSEPVRAETLDRFAAAFRDVGFRRRAFYPCYGLAEATLLVSGGDAGGGPTVAAFADAELERGSARSGGGGAATRRVSCGHAWHGQEVLVVDPQSRLPLGAGAVGEVWVHGDSVAAGYWNRPRLTARTFRARRGDDDGRPYLRTGDLGFVAAGELFIAGRLKDLVIIRGRNLYPQDVERLAEAVDPALRLGSGAAFAVEAGGEERLVVVQEVERRRQDEVDADRLVQAIVSAVVETFAVRPHEVVVVAAGAVPKTSSGKVRRRATRDLYLDDALPVLARSGGLAPAPATLEAAAAPARDELAAVAGEQRAARLEPYLAGLVAGLAGVTPEAVRAAGSLARAGLDSLRVVELANAIEGELGIAPSPVDLLRADGFDELVAVVAAAFDDETRRRRVPAAAPRAEREQPLSPEQRGLWLLDRRAPEEAVYNVGGALRLPGRLQPAALRRALDALAERHPELRTTFHERDGEPFRRLHASLRPELVEGRVEGMAAAAVRQRLAELLARPFDLAAGPLLRLGLFDAGDHQIVLLAVHHLVADLWSLGVAVRDLGALYQQASRGAEPALPRLETTFGEHAERRWAWLGGPEAEALAQRWRARLVGIEALELPLDRPRPPTQTSAAGAVRLRLPTAVTAGLHRAARAQDATLFTTLLGVVQVLLHRASGQDDLVVGVPHAGRDLPGLAPLVGHFVNMVPMRADLAGRPRFAGLLQRVRRSVLDDLAAAEYPFPLFVERFGARRDPSRSPVFQVAFALQRSHLPELGDLAAAALGGAEGRVDFAGLPCRPEPVPVHRVQYDLTVLAAERDAGLDVSLQYNRDLFDPSTMLRLAGQLQRLLAAFAAAPEAFVDEPSMLSAAERHAVLLPWNDTARDFGSHRPVHRRVCEQAARRPRALALRGGGEALSYAELEERSARLAGHLAARGVGPEARVALCLAGSPALVVAALAVLRAGGAYLPLDPAVPDRRLAEVVADARPRLLITTARRAEAMPQPSCPVLRFDADEAVWRAARRLAAEPPADPAQAAYVIYTSGSTGVPNGVVVHHRGLLNLVDWHLRAYGVTAADRAAQVASPAFDASVWEVWPYLAAGASVHVAAPEVRTSPAELTAWLAEQRVTLAFLPTPVAEAALSERWPGNVALRALLTGGDRLRRRPPRDLPFRLVNHYGPTEGSVVATASEVAVHGSGAPPIGRPIDNVRAYVVDRWLHPAPPAVAGELCLGGAGLARGYLGRPRLTARRFVPDPFGAAPGGRLYRTGDRVRRRADGELDFLGRLDQQVQLGGVRVELGEVESLLAAHPAVREVAVLARGGVLAAWVVPAAGCGLRREELCAHLAEHLPETMVPKVWSELAALPLTGNGKLDRRALPEPRLAGGGEPPQGPLEERLAALWSELLEVAEVGRHDSFFALGGHSLLAARLAARLRRDLGVELPVRALFEAPTVAQQARLVDAARRGAPPAPAPRTGGDRDLPLSPAQERLWFLEQLAPGRAVYNVPAAARLRGRLVVGALRGALERVSRRHEALRTRFDAIDGRPRQSVEAAAGLPLAVIDLAGLPTSRRGGEAARLLRRLAGRSFELSEAPLARAALIRGAAREHTLVLSVHHLVTDGWSLAVLVREVGELYAAALEGRTARLPAPALQHADYAVWQRAWLAGAEPERQLAWWRERLAGYPTVLELPTDRPRPPAASFRGGEVDWRLDAAQWAAVRELAERREVTPFLVLAAAFEALLARVSGQTRLLLGTPVANRRYPEVEGVVGLLVNTLVLRGEAEGRFTGLLAAGREELLAADEHQDLPFERLVEALEPERDLSRNPIFQVMLSWQDAEPVTLRLRGLDCEPLAAPAGVSRFDLTLFLVAGAGRLEGRLEYAVDLFDRSTVERWGGHLRTLLSAALAEPEREVWELPLMSAAERRQVLEAWNRTSAPPAAGRLHDRVLAQAAATPRRVALVAGGERLSYGELARRSAALAGRLRSLGVGAESRVGVCLERRAELVVALLAVLRAGGAYVPIDPAYPAARVAQMMADSGAAVVVTERGLAPRLPAGGPPRLYVDAAPAAVEGGGEAPAPATAENLAYVLFTSGSTGRPKGVAIPHRAAVALVSWALARFDGEELSGVLAATSVCFDLSVFELFVPLSAGGTVVLVEDALALASAPVRDAVRLVNTVPSALAELLAAGGLPASVKTVNLAGEPLPWPLAQAIHAGGTVERLYNLYGPSEDTTYSTWARVTAEDRRPPAIGRPITNGRAYVVDRTLRPVPVGVVGELWLGGAGLARGYLGRPGLTAASFVPDPFGGEAGGRLYRTGDRVRRRPDGELEFLGRLDQQVKVRGFRVELGEVEAALAAHPAVREAAAGVRGERLAAWVAPVAGGELDAAVLRGHLEQRLPAYMVPSLWTRVEALPRTPNGKLDRRALPAPRPAGDAGEPPQGPLEERLAALWSELLEVAVVGRHDSFFALGGHSLLATRLVARLRRDLGVELPVRAVFEAPTVARLARQVEAARRSAPPASPAPPPIEALPRRGAAELPLSYAQERLWFLEQLGDGGAVYNVPAALELRGALAVGALRGALEQVSRRHEALRTRFGAVDGEPHQQVDPDARLRLAEVDLAALPVARRAGRHGGEAGDDGEEGGEAARLLRRLAGRSFELSEAPLARAALIRGAAREHTLVLSVHHLVTDGWSLAVLVREVGELYAAALEGRTARLPAPALQHADYAVWQRAWLAGAELERQLAWWRERLAGYPTVLELPTDRPRPPAASFRGGEVDWRLDAAQWAAVRELAERREVTPFLVLAAAFEALLARVSGQTRLLLGTPVANRRYPEVEGVVGLLVNTLVLRGEAEGRFTGLLAAGREELLAADEHQDLPFERLVEALEPERDLSRNPVFQVMLVLQNAGRLDLDLPGVAAQARRAPAGTSRFDLTLALFEDRGRLEGRLEYAVDLFDRSTVERWGGHLRTLLSAALAEPEREVWELPLMSAAERRQVLEAWNRTSAPPAAGRLHDRVLAQAAATPRRVALVAGGERLSYGELARRSAALAGRLRSLGVGAESRVGVCLERRAELVVALLAVLRAGGAYVPIDPAYPAARVAQMMADSGAAVVVTERGLAPRLPAGGPPRLYVDAAPAAVEGGGEAPAPATAENLAYVLFTSGSTGRPKGVAIPHRAAVALVSWALARFDGEELSGVLAATSVCFDLSVFELFVPLSAGGTVVLVEDALALASAPVRDAVRLVNTVPSALAELLAAGGLPASVKTVNLAGEPLPWPLAQAIHAGGTVERLYNLYGPSEDTTYSTWARVTAEDRRPPAIGRPITNGRAYVVDRTLRPVPVGVVGELWLGGAGLARGYLGRPGLTAASFVPDPFGGEAGGRLYRTGDRVRRRPDGELEFLGRLDQQVKVRGFRVELGEVEAALAAHPAVREAAAGVRGERLAAWVAPVAGGELDAAVLRGHLEQRLPAYMVPSLWTRVEALPRTPNGKLDRRALPAPRPAGDAGEPPQGPLEERLAALWSELLEVAVVGRHDSFFALGGHSLLATRLVARLRRDLGVELPVRAVFEAPTVARLARQVEAARRSAPPASPAPPPIEALPRRGAAELPLSYAQERLWFLEQLGDGGAVYNVPAALELRGALAVGALRGALEQVSRRHEALRTRFGAVDGEPHQQVDPDARLRLAEVDLAALPGRCRAGEQARLHRRLSAARFDLATPPLARAALVRTAAAESSLLLVLHRAIADEGSPTILQREVSELYAAALGDRPARLPELALQPADVAVWERGRGAEDQPREIAWWRRRLEGFPTVLELPTDHRRPPEPSFRGGVAGLRLDAEAWAAVVESSRRRRVTPFMTLLTAFELLLADAGGQRRLLVGTPLADRFRGRIDVDGVVGPFAGTLVLRADLRGDPSLGELLAAVRAEVLTAQEHQSLPFEALVPALEPVRDLSRPPLVQAMLSFAEAAGPVLELPGVTVTPRSAAEPTARYDLHLRLTHVAGGLQGGLEVAADLFSAATAERLANRFRRLLLAIAEGPSSRRFSELASTGEPAGVRTRPTAGTTAARSLTEEVVLEVWAEMLQHAAPGRDEDFFELGGHSYLALRVMTRLSDRLGVDLPPRLLFEERTVARLGERIDRHVSEARP